MLTPQQLHTLSELLDAALDMAPAERASWLDALPPDVIYLRSTLAGLLAREAAFETDEILCRPPPMELSGSTSSLQSDLQPGVAIGPYRLVREVGRGGMSTVWFAERTDGHVRREVALKLPHAGLHNRQFEERLARERDILARLTHPNIARLYDAGVSESGQPYLAMEYIEGVPLIAYCDQQRMNIRERLRLFLQVLGAVQFAHSQLVLHRDIKPSNILVTAQRHVMLLDFGIAKLLNDGESQETELTQLGGRALTPDYASPEQIAGQPLGTASDVYSLGVILCELLAGARPYRLKRMTRGALEEAILDIEPARPSVICRDANSAMTRATTPDRLARSLRNDLDAVVLHALRKQPAQRYSTVQALAEDVRRYLDDQPVAAKSDSWLYRTSKILWRHRFAALSAVLVLIALTVGLTTALWQAHRAQQHETTALAVQAFLRDIFRANSNTQADPMKARQTTARELLDIGARRVDKSLADSPESKMDVLETLADLYWDLGLDDEASSLAQQRVTIAQSLYGVGDERTVEPLIDVINMTHSANHPEGERAALDAVRAILDRRGDHDSSLRAALLKADAQYLESTDRAQALRASEAAVALYRKLPPTAASADAYFRLGISYYNVDRFAAALENFTAAADVGSRTGDAGTADLLRYHTYEAQCLDELARYEEAEKKYREAVRVAHDMDGGAGVNSIQVAMRFGVFLFNSSRRQEALSYLAAATNTALATRGADDAFHTPLIRDAYGVQLLRFGQPEAALAQIVPAVEVRRKSRPNSFPLTRMLENEATALVELGDLSQAQALLDESLAIHSLNRDAGRSLDGYKVARTYWLLGRGDLIAAQKLADELIIDTRDGLPVARSWLNVNVIRLRTALARGANDEVLKLGMESLKKIRSSPQARYWAHFEAGAALAIAQADVSLHRESEGLPMAQRADELITELNDPNGLWLAESKMTLAQSYLALGRKADARIAFDRASSILATHPRVADRYRNMLAHLENQLHARH